MSLSSEYWQSKAMTAKSYEICKMLIYISFGFFASEYIYTLPFDLSILKGKRQRRWYQLAYFGTKYFWITYVLSTFILLWNVHEIKCGVLFDFVEFQMGLVVCLSSFLLAARTICVYQGKARKIVTGVLTIFGLGLAAAWICGVKDVTAVWSPEAALPFNDGLCAVISVKSSYWAKYVMTILFDLLVLVLTTVGIIRMDSQSRIGDVLVRHGLIYFILTFAANLIVTVLTALHLSPMMSLIAAVPQSTVCVICSTRLYIMLVKEAKQEVRTSIYTASSSSQDLQSPTKSGFSSYTNFFSRRNSSNMINHVPYSSSNNSNSNSNSNSNNHNQQLMEPSMMEKAITAPSSTFQSNVRIEQTRRIEVDPLPPYLSGTHPFGRSIGSVQEEDDTLQNGSVAAAFPRLSTRKRPEST